MGSSGLDQPFDLLTASASELADRGLALDRAGDVAHARTTYEAAVERAEAESDYSTLARVLRQLAILHHLGNDPVTARRLAARSHRVALAAGDQVLAANALNALAGFALERGELDAARSRFRQAAALGGADPALRGRVEQNLGIIANVQGDWLEARRHYESSLAAFRDAGDERGAAIAYHNLGMVSADHGDLAEAERYLGLSGQAAARLGDVRLENLARLNRAEVCLELGNAPEALAEASLALRIFTELGAELDRADAYRVIGSAYRETGQRQLAESRLLEAVRLSELTGAALSEAEALRELAVLFHDQGRNQDSLRSLTRSHRIFGRLDARHELVDIANRVRSLETTYLDVVRNWGQSIESADSYTHGHCERVAGFGTALAEAMGLDEMTQKTIELGAYLHDLGKVRVPHEILNKPGRLTAEEFAVIQRHPEWGIEMLADVEFPWDLKPIIRSHHERRDGTGYPDRLAGDEIPVTASLICIVDVWDALTTTRSYRTAMTVDQALAVMRDSAHWWSAELARAFHATIPQLTQSV